MRAIWKGAITFGLVSVGVKLYSAVDEQEPKFRQVHSVDGGRIQYVRRCAECGEEVGYADIAKGHDVGDGEMVILSDEDLSNLPLPSSRAAEVLEFVPAEQVDPIYLRSSYLLAPSEKEMAKAYLLFRDALAGSGLVALTKITLRTRERLAIIRVGDHGALILTTMVWSDEIRSPKFKVLTESPPLISEAEAAMASALIKAMVSDFHPERHKDNYREALREVIATKIEGIVQGPPQREEKSNTRDLIAALAASVEAIKRERSEDYQAA